MATPTHDEMLFLVRKRFPNMEANMQQEVATRSLTVLAEPHWRRINPILAVKIAAHRVQRPGVTV